MVRAVDKANAMLMLSSAL